MNKGSEVSQVEEDALTADVVAAYLSDRPDFFTTRPELVDRLALPHRDQGTVSLVHVQMNRQRQRIEELEEEITVLMSLAKNNDRTFHEFMDLQQRLLQCDSMLKAVKAIEEMAKSLGLVAYVRLFDSDLSYYRLAKEAFQRFSTNHLNGKEAYLGRMRKVDRELLFGDNTRAPEMGSYVVLPLAAKSPLGMLAFSSSDGGHFQPHMDTLFLRQLALLVSHLIQFLPWQNEEDKRISSTPA